MQTRDLADWWTRAGAFVLDQLIVAAVVFAIAFGIADTVPQPGETRGSLAFYGIALVVGFLYAPLLMARGGARNGQTLGKQLLGIRVAREDGSAMGFWHGVLRTVVAQQLLIAVTFYVYAVVDYLWPLRDAHNQALHDKVAKTRVLRAAASAATPRPGAQPPASPGGWLPPQAPGA